MTAAGLGWALDHATLAQALLPAVLEAGAVEMRYYRSGVTVETKADQSPVTLADQEAETILIAALQAAAPSIAIVAEEAVAGGAIPELGTRFFLVDPLDGTREFINKRDEFTVNIALVEGGVPQFGIVYVPAHGDLYMTLAPGRSVLGQVRPDDGARQLADVAFRDIHVRAPDFGRLTAVASRSHLTPETETYLNRYNVASRRDAGSSLKFCLIARGEADIYPRLGPTMAWDTAAGHAVLLAAGGMVTELSGTPLTYGLRSSGSLKERLLNPHFVAWGCTNPTVALGTP